MNSLRLPEVVEVVGGSGDGGDEGGEQLEAGSLGGYVVGEGGEGIPAVLGGLGRRSTGGPPRCVLR